MTARNIVIVMGRCMLSKQGFGVRFESRGSEQWTATWAFPIKEEAARREGYEKTRMAGKFTVEQTFPGCPHCTAQRFWVCQCGKLACWNGESRRVICPACAQAGELTRTINSIEGGGDR
jgi:hypothetical protein